MKSPRASATRIPRRSAGRSHGSANARPTRASRAIPNAEVLVVRPDGSIAKGDFAAQMEQSASSRATDVTAIFSRGGIVVTVQVDHHVEGRLPPPRRAEELQMPGLSQASGHCEFA